MRQIVACYIKKFITNTMLILYALKYDKNMNIIIIKIKQNIRKYFKIGKYLDYI